MSKYTLQPATLITPATGAVTTEATFPVEQKHLRATLMATGLAGAETIPVFFSVDNGATFEAASEDGTPIELTATSNTIAINSPVFIGVTKPSTAGAAGVFLMTNQQADPK